MPKSHIKGRPFKCGVWQNAVNELLKSGRPIDKILIRKDGGRPLSVIVAKSNRVGHSVVEADKESDGYAENHQGCCPCTRKGLRIP